MLPSKQVPVGSLSIQSFHDDSPPFTGAGDSAPYPPPFDLSSSTSPLAHSVLGSGPPTPGLGGPSAAAFARFAGGNGATTSTSPSNNGGNGPSNGVRSTVNNGNGFWSNGFGGLDRASSPAPQAADEQQQRRPTSRASSSSSSGGAASSDPLVDPAGTIAGSSASATTVPPSDSQQTLTASGRPSSPPRPSRSASGGEVRHAKDGEADQEAQLDSNATPNVDSGRFLAGTESYTFPRHRLRDVWEDESKIPLVIVACGSFSPPTYLHLRMFEMAKDQIEEDGRYEILGGYYSPVSDHYKKAGLAPATDRVKMCELGVETTSMWLMVDPWEAGQDSYQRTAVVLQHFEEEINGGEKGGARSKSGKHTNVKIMLLAGGDLIESFGHPGVWAEDDLHIILGHFGCLIIERTGSDVWAFLLSHDILHYYRKNIIVVKQLIYNDISSTKVRLFVRRGMSIKYLLPNSVISYILERGLYRNAPFTVPLEITPTTTPAPPHAISTPEPVDDEKTFFVSNSPTTPAASLPSVSSATTAATSTPKATVSTLSTPTAASS